VRKLIPEITGLHFPLEWVFHQSAIISLENPQPGMVRETARLLWETSWFSAARLLIFIDGKADVTDMSGTAWQFVNNCSFGRDVIGDSSGTRLALDATGACLPQRLGQDPGILQRVEKRWHEYGLA